MAGQRQVGNARTPPGGGLARPKMPLRLSGVPVWAAFPRRSLRSMSPDAATSTGASARERLDALVARLGVRELLLLSLAFLVPQQALTRYLRGEDGANVFWLAVGFLLLWFVYRRSSLAARAFSVYTAVIGALLYGSQIPREGLFTAVPRAALLRPGAPPDGTTGARACEVISTPLLAGCVP